MIVYSKTNGKAHDVRLVKDTYVLQAGELSLAGSVIPALVTLNDPPAQAEVIDAQITALEEATPVTPRALREFMLMVLQFANVSPSVNPKFAAIAQLDAQIQVLRSQR